MLGSRSWVSGARGSVLVLGVEWLGIRSWVLGSGFWLQGDCSWARACPPFMVLFLVSCLVLCLVLYLGARGGFGGWAWRDWALGLGFWVLGACSWVSGPGVLWSLALGLGSWFLVLGSWVLGFWGQGFWENQ